MAQQPEKLGITPEGVVGTATEALDIDQMLNSDGFAEFLGRYPDAKELDMEDETAVAERFDVFNQKEGVKEDMRAVYGDHIAEEWGVKLGKKELGSIDKHLDKLAIEDPQSLLKLREQLDLFNTLPAEIGMLERQLAQLGDPTVLGVEINKLQDQSDDLDLAKKHLGFGGVSMLALKTMGKYVEKAWLYMPKALVGAPVEPEDAEKLQGEIETIKADWKALREVKETFGAINKKEAGSIKGHVDSRIAAIESALSAITDTKRLKEEAEKSFNDTRRELFVGISDIKDLKTAIQGKVKEQLKELTVTGTLKGLDEAQARFEEIQGLAEDNEAGINPFGRSKPEKFQREIDVAIEIAAADEIADVLENTNMGANTLTRLEEKLKPLLEKKKMGSREDDEVKEFILGKLDEAAQSLGKSNADRAKRLIIRRIVAKNRTKGPAPEAVPADVLTV